MKYLFTLFFCIYLGCMLHAQNVGLGTTKPHPSALLELKSTTKGMLMPKMSNFERLAIPAPANGLLVYDTVYNEFYHYEGSKWVTMLSSNYWIRPARTRDRIGNSSDSVGIGNASPTHRLDVSGNIRSREDILADGRVVATGIVSGSGLQTSGGLTVSSNGLIGGNFTASGDLSTNSGLQINNATGTLTFKTGGIDKGFVQLSGDNLRLGTHSSNTNGSTIFRNGGEDIMTVSKAGSVGIGNSGQPFYKLTVSGNTELDGRLDVRDGLRLTGTLINPDKGFANNLVPLCYGTVRNGALVRGTSNVSLFWVSYDEYNGYYRMSCDGINSNSIILVTPLVDHSLSGGGRNYVYTAVADYYSSGKANVHILLNITKAHELYYEKADFSFVIY